MLRNISSIFAVLAVLSLVLLSGCSKPEEAIVDHMENMNEIMEDNMDSPRDGVEELRTYMHKNLPDIMAQLGKATVELDKIEDGKDRAKRAEEMVKAITSASESMAETGMKFGGKVMEDEEAMKYLEQWGESWEGVGETMDALKGLSRAIM